MRYGCLGEKLKHSFSKEIHSKLADYEYELIEVARDKLDTFMKARDFAGINVTIPYKEAVIPYLDFVDEAALRIGAVNTVVNKDGKLYGYNTDFYGMSKLMEKIAPKSFDKVVILGSGGTAKTAFAVAQSLGAKEIYKVSRKGKDGAVTYEELYEKHTDATVIINTTPVGMYPDIFSCPVDIARFTKLSGVLDAVYNPLCTPLVIAAKKRGISAEGGLYMLVAQAVRASEIFTDTTYSGNALRSVFWQMQKMKENIVLTGMPGAGKTTVGRLLSDMTGRELVDTDELIAELEGESISEIFQSRGEKGFRDAETKAIRQASALTGVIIATGGGAILREENVDALRENGRVYFIDRPLDRILPTDDRPLSSTRETLIQRYNERYYIYCTTCDKHIKAACTAEKVAEKILTEFAK